MVVLGAMIIQASVPYQNSNELTKHMTQMLFVNYINERVFHPHTNQQLELLPSLLSMLHFPFQLTATTGSNTALQN